MQPPPSCGQQIREITGKKITRQISSEIEYALFCRENRYSVAISSDQTQAIEHEKGVVGGPNYNLVVHLAREEHNNFRGH